MAVKLSNKPGTEAISTDYEFGSIRDQAGATPGTPVSRLVYGDFHQWFEKLMQLASITHNDLPDNTTNGYQLMQAFGRIATGNSISNLYSLDQSSTSAPTINALNSDLLPFSSVTASRSSAGKYKVIFSPDLDTVDGLPNAVMLIPSSGQATSSANETIDCFMSNGEILVNTYLSGTPTDGILDNYVFELRLIAPTLY